jgi:D-alanine--poly(phosphoribitol) ligase subunit 1
MTPNLWNLFASRAAVGPHDPALIVDHRRLSFSDLRILAILAAARLAEHGVRRSDVVALALPKRPTTYALLLGCLRLGAPYVFIEPKSPAERTARIIDRTRPRLVIGEVTIPNPHGDSVLLEEADGEAWLLSATPDRSLQEPSNAVGTDPAYIMFTSGSTGEPKGAVIPHQGVASLVRWARNALGIGPGERLTAINPIHFDNSVFDIYCGLLNGAALVPIETGQVSNPASWVRTIRQAEATMMFAVPTLFLILDQVGLLTPKSLSSVRTFVFGGEGFPIGRLRSFYQRFDGRARLVNVYGPTETSCICASAVVNPEMLQGPDTMFPPLGRMHEEFSHAILDEAGGEVRAGEVGELWIGGPCVGLGYYNNPEETGARFRQDPRQSLYRSILYRSGDLVRDEGGQLWFQGRADNQVKIRGHRIELEEVDLVVQSLDGVRRAIAVVIETVDGPGIGLAYAAEGDVLPETVEAHCRKRLAGYMRPARIRKLDDLPRNANGKVDRGAVRKLFDDPR